MGKTATVAAAWLATLLNVGCSVRPESPLPLTAPPATECAQGTAPLVGLSVTAIDLPLSTRVEDELPAIRGTLARRLVISATPEGLSRGVRMIWSRLSVRSFGGTFTKATRLTTAFSSATLTAHSPAIVSRSGRRREIIGLQASPGEITVTRSALGRTSLFGLATLDFVLQPGGVPVDETLVAIPELWTRAGHPIAPPAVDIELVPVRHPPGIGEVDAAVTLDYTLEAGRAAPARRCSAQAHVVLATRADSRPPLWDLGTSELNEGRTAWIALYDARLGPFRAIFDSPQAARAFANWGRATRSTTVGRFSIGLFTAQPGIPQRPMVPVDRSIARTLRPIVARDWNSIRAGPLDEP
ncbi:MAG: hypothetical protein ACREU3_08710 [Steroidobacteraceae bacterium]